MSEQPSPAGYEEELNDPFEHEEPGVGETSIESFLRKVLLEKQIITEEQLLECIEERRGKTPPPPLASLLLKKGYLDDEQLEDLLRALGSRRQTSHADDSLALGESAVRKGLTSNAEILDALEMQEREQQKGASPRLGEVLVRRGTLTVAQVKDIIGKQGRRILKCSKCGNQYNVHSFSSDKKYTCLNCGGRLSDSGTIDSLDVEGTAPDRGAAMQSLDDMFVGKRVGPCEIIDKIGEGGMGAVYKATHIALNKTVAVKIMSPAVMGEAHKQRFLREARAAASLEHPNVVVVHDTGEEAGFPFIIMQYIEGKSLAEIIRMRGKIPPKQALRVIVASASALAAAHEKNIIHRDIKPDNIMITAKGEIKVTDFGLAKNVQKGDMTITAAGTVMGTPVYMSPEQFEAKPVDARSDIYSLGVTLYRILAGKAPYSGDTVVALWQAHVNEAPPPLTDDVPPELSDIVYRMIEKEPADRYQNATELIADLKQAYLQLGWEEEGDDYLLLMDSMLAAGEAAKKKKLAKAVLLGVAVVVLAVVLALFLSRKRPQITHPTPGEMEIFNTARLEADTLATRKEYTGALGVWDRFNSENPEDFWAGLVEKEREHVLQIANEKLHSMFNEAGTLADGGNLEMAKSRCGEILRLSSEILATASSPEIGKVSQLTGEKLAAVEELISKQAELQPKVDARKLEKWKKAKELVGNQITAGRFASARATVLPFTYSDYPLEIRKEAEQLLARIEEKREQHKELLAAEERIRFEQDMLDARNCAESGECGRAREILKPYLEHLNKEFKKEAQQVLSEVRHAEAFTTAMEEVEKLRRQNDFSTALRICDKYMAGGNRKWADIASGKCLQIKKERFLDRNLLYVGGGTFTAGSKDPSDNNPHGDVTLKPFYIGKFEVTCAEYRKFAEETGHGAPDNWPGGKPGSGHVNVPVTLITVGDAGAYCAWLTKKDGVKYRLPTDAEWEFAASWDGQKKLTFPWGEKYRKDICNIDGDLLPSGQCKGDLSPAGAYDMAGNACEMVTSNDGKSFAVRGGCCDDAGNPRSARGTYRQTCDRNTTGASIGFRIVREDD